MVAASRKGLAVDWDVHQSRITDQMASGTACLPSLTIANYDWTKLTKVNKRVDLDGPSAW